MEVASLPIPQDRTSPEAARIYPLRRAYSLLPSHKAARITGLDFRFSPYFQGLVMVLLLRFFSVAIITWLK